MVQIVPAILAKTEQEYKDKLSQIEQSKFFEGGWVQIDFMDNKFVPNLSIGTEIVAKYPTKQKIEAQLMVEDPYFWATKFKGIEVIRFIAPIETDKELLDRFVSFVKSNTEAEVGFSFNPSTDINRLEDYKEIAQAVLIMSVNPGFGGQDFMINAIEKIKKAARLRQNNNLHFLIGVDGGISSLVTRNLAEAGANYLVIGSHLFEGDIDENIEKIWESIQN